MSIGFEGGGDDIASFTYQNGKKATLKAGSGILVTGGISVANPISNFELSTRANFGFKVMGLTATNAELDFFRWILEVSEFYTIPDSRFQVGAGLAYHISNKLKGKKDAAYVDGKLDPSLGFSVGVEYFLQRDKDLPLRVKSALIGLRYTIQSYSPGELSANNFGLNLSMTW